MKILSIVGLFAIGKWLAKTDIFKRKTTDKIYMIGRKKQHGKNKRLASISNRQAEAHYDYRHRKY